MTQPSAIRSVNWHLISACNYSCRFCFAQNLGEKPVTYAEGCRVLTRLADAGMEKINFAGGEPLLHPHLFDYCHCKWRDQSAQLWRNKNAHFNNIKPLLYKPFRHGGSDPVAAALSVGNYHP